MNKSLEAFRTMVAVCGAVLSSQAATFTVTTPDDGGDGSLRWAIEQANASSGPDLIAFAIEGAGPHIIQPLSALPRITDPVILDGATQAGSHPNTRAGWQAGDAAIGIVVDGALAGEYVEGVSYPIGLHVTAGDSTIRGLAVVNFACHGIALVERGGNVVEGCILGADASGMVGQGNGLRMPWPGAGLVIGGCADNRVGGIRPECRNLISGNGYGIQIEPGDRNVIQGNFVGTNREGAAAIANQRIGIRVFGPWEGYSAVDNRIGGAEPGAGNLISGNHDPASDADAWASARGIQAESGPWMTIIEGNRIGTDVTGKLRLGNDWGLQIGSGTGCRVGGTDPGAGNLVSGNRYLGMFIQGIGHSIEGNLVGTDVDGGEALGNGYEAVSWGPIGGMVIAWAFDCTVGGLTAAARNVVSDNQSYGGLGIGGDGGGHRILGNYFGTDITGMRLLGQQDAGVYIHQTTGNHVGGPESGAGNVFGGGGIDLRAPGNAIQGNHIGVDAAGQDLLRPGVGGGAGIYLADVADENLIGGTAPGAGNLIAGWGRAVEINGRHRNRIQGNVIGTDRDAVVAWGNGEGISLYRGASDNLVGGVEPGAGNLIAHNLGNGVVVTDSDSIPYSLRNSIRGNSIRNNGELGINLMPWGPENPWAPGAVSPNDANDLDLGPNGLQNFPVLTGASALIGSSRIDGALDSTPNTTFTLDFYANGEADPSGHGEGETYLGSASVTTDANGDVTFSVVVPRAATPGHFLTATATDPDGNTSEFSGQSPPVIRGVIEVGIDIKPGSFPNSINLGSDGTVPVAILGSATFDAATVDPTTVTLADATVKLQGRGTPMASLQDVNGDGRKDLVVHVLTAALQLSATDTLAVLRGQTTDGMPIEGSDTVRVVP